MNDLNRLIDTLHRVEPSTADAGTSPPVAPVPVVRPPAHPALFWTVTGAAVAILLLAAGLHWAGPPHAPSPSDAVARLRALPPAPSLQPSKGSGPASNPAVSLPDKKAQIESGSASVVESSQDQPGNRAPPSPGLVPVTAKAAVPLPKPVIAPTPTVDSSAPPHPLESAAAAVVESPVKTTPAGLVRKALVAEASGDRARSETALREALAMDPGYAPAKWLCGCLRWEGRWLGWEEVQKKVQADSRLAEYRKLRDAQAASPLGHLALARWCQSQGLVSKARVHWMYVLEAEPHHAEALTGLGMQWWQGQLLTEAQIKQWKQANTREARESVVKEERRWIRYWERRLPAWRRALECGESTVHTEIAAELGSAKGPMAAHSLGTLLMNRSLRKSEQDGDHALSLELVHFLRESMDHWVPAQLVRHAVDHPTSEVRTAAADALKNRPKETFVPHLLWRMQLPIEAGTSLVSLGGGVIYQISLDREGPDALFAQTRTFYLTAIPTFRRDPRWDGLRAYLRIRAVVADAQQRLEAASAETPEVNRRVQAALCRAVGEEFPPDPIACQRWWSDYCRDYYEVGESYYTSDRDTCDSRKPVHETSFHRFGNLFHSCFRRDTPVWTSTGKAPIQQVKPGDCVLSKHPRTGELAYKPILQVTLRKPAPMLKIGLGSETIFATRGHPFWVCGEGWKMAKQLKAGMRVLALSGTVLVDGVEEVPAPGAWYQQLKERPDAQPEDVAAYNLVVDDFHTYFVGGQKLLVHDNVLFPLDGPLSGMPGL